MTIAYKVVEKRTRNCSNMTLYTFYKHRRELGNKIREEYPEWFPVYKKGTTVKMAPNSAGILCFTSYHAANGFKRDYDKLQNRAMIIKVKGIDMLTSPNMIYGACGTSPEYLYSRSEYQRRTIPAPYRTIAFKSVKVLE